MTQRVCMCCLQSDRSVPLTAARVGCSGFCPVLLKSVKLQDECDLILNADLLTRSHSKIKADLTSATFSACCIKMTFIPMTLYYLYKGL